MLTVVLVHRLCRCEHPVHGEESKVAVMGKSAQSFNAQTFLDSAGLSKKIVEYGRAEVIFSQGDTCESVMYIQKGGVKLSVLSKIGREAVVAMLGPGDFFGEGCLAGQSIRIGSATAITPCSILLIEKDQMAKVLHKEHALSDRFIWHMVSRNVGIEQDLIDQLFNSSEKRLARALLGLARYGKQDQPRRFLPKLSPEKLADMVGTTPLRIDFFMKKFKRLGFIDTVGGLRINNSLLSVVLHD
jgi:CRP/FNR family transcriptional regulator, cyclic AMP receptor protein